MAGALIMKEEDLGTQMQTTITGRYWDLWIAFSA
jgi:hypothetical protein